MAKVMSLSELLDSMSGESAESDPKKEGQTSGLKLEALLMDLRDAAAAFVATNPFKVGDVVTPKDNVGYKQAGEPMIVIEIADPPHRDWTRGSYPHGHRYDVRVMTRVDEGAIIPIWYEHWCLDFYKAP